MLQVFLFHAADACIVPGGMPLDLHLECQWPEAVGCTWEEVDYVQMLACQRVLRKAFQKFI